MDHQTTGEEQFGLGELPMDVTNWLHAPAQNGEADDRVEEAVDLWRDARLAEDPIET